MLDRKQYESLLNKAKQEQIEEISSYLKESIELNTKIRELPFCPDDSKELLDEVSSIEIPRVGRPTKEVADELINKVFSKSMLVQHPKFLSFVTSAVSPYSLAGAILSDIYNLNSGGFENAPTASIIEDKLIKRMGSLAGFDDSCGSVFTSGGSLANLSGCMAARINLLEEDDYHLAVAYCSDQTHSSEKRD